MTLMKRLFFYIYFFISAITVLFSQNTEHRIDSLKLLLKDSSDVALTIHRNLLLEKIYRNINTDSSFYFAKKALSFAIKTHLDRHLDEIYAAIAANNKLTGNIKKAENLYKKSLWYAVKFNDSSTIANVYGDLGVLYFDQGQYKKALEYNMKSIEIADKINYLYSKGLALNNIGLIYYMLGDYDLSLAYYNKALQIKKKLKDLSGIALLYNNIAIIYYYKNNIDKVFMYFHKALKIWRKQQNLRQMALTLANLGELYLEQKDLNKALGYVLHADEINEGLKNIHSQIYTKILIGDIYFNRKRYFKAQEYYNKAIVLAKEIKSNQDLHDLYKKMSDLFEASGDIQNAYKYYKLKTAIQDSLLNTDKQKAIEELQTKYETKKKKQEIKLLNNQKKLSDEIQRNQKIIILSLAGGLILVLFLVFIIIKRNIERQKANELLAKKNDEIAHQKEELTSSIAYAKRIQTAMLPQYQIVDKSLKDYFILFKPKDMVSGDFFWWTHFDNYTILSVSDCTGHGVPGAFMSILGVSFLREIVSKEKIIHPGTILNRLRKEIITALHQKGIYGEQKDGMDMSLITINHSTNTLQFAGANNSIYIIRSDVSEDKKDINDFQEESRIKKELSNNEKTFYEIKPDKMPIAIFFKMKPFNTVEIQLQSSDRIYLFSDGYADQFGGQNGKKFKYKPFKNLLFENSHKPMKEQKDVLEKTFVAWKNNFEQIDDITIVGIKI